MRDPSESCRGPAYIVNMVIYERFLKPNCKVGALRWTLNQRGVDPMRLEMTFGVGSNSKSFVTRRYRTLEGCKTLQSQK